MAKIFLSYRFTGENTKKLEKILWKIRDGLQGCGHQIFCTFWMEDFFKKNGFSTDQIYQYGLEKVDESEIFFALVKSEHHSKGMKMESERAIENGKRYILAIKKGLQFPDFREAADQIIEYESLEELYSILPSIKTF